MSGDYVTVSGIDRGDQPSEIYVWCRAEGQADLALIETTHAIGKKNVRPPGIQVGQFNVTFQLPAGCEADDIVVTSDKGAKAQLQDVAVTRCS